MKEQHSVINVNPTSLQLPQDISLWSTADVFQWLKQNGFSQLKNNLANSSTPVNGQSLLSLNYNQLQQPPFLMTDLHEIDHLQSCINGLKRQQLKEYMNKDVQNGFHYAAAKKSNMENGHTLNKEKKNGYLQAKEPLVSDKERYARNLSDSAEHFPPEIFKTILAFCYMMFGFFVSVFMLQVVHERVPPIDKQPPLPDVFFDLVPSRVEGAFSVCEWVGIVLTGICALIFFFHKHRFIVVRRIFCIMGTLYLYRSLTIYVTTLPVPGFHFRCAPKVNYKLTTMIYRAVVLLSGGGLSVTGAHNYCGDYLFSGHTVILVITCLMIVEYTPKRMWLLHWTSEFCAVIAIVCILLAHDHYTIDVVIAYLLTTRLFWSYHTMCNVTALKEASKSNLFSRVWWFPLFHYFESKVVSNGPLPHQFEWPLPWPKRLVHLFNHRRTPVKGV